MKYLFLVPTFFAISLVSCHTGNGIGIGGVASCGTSKRRDGARGNTPRYDGTSSWKLPQYSDRTWAGQSSFLDKHHDCTCVPSTFLHAYMCAQAIAKERRYPICDLSGGKGARLLRKSTEACSSRLRDKNALPPGVCEQVTLDHATSTYPDVRLGASAHVTVVLLLLPAHGVVVVEVVVEWIRSFQGTHLCHDHVSERCRQGQKGRTNMAVNSVLCGRENATAEKNKQARNVNMTEGVLR